MATWPCCAWGVLSLPYPLYTSGHIATIITGSFHVVVRVLGADIVVITTFGIYSFCHRWRSTLNVQPSVYKSRYDSQEVRISSKA